MAYVRRIRILLTRRRFDVLWIEKEALPWLPVWLESALLRGVPYVLDYDDAVFHNYDRHRLSWVRHVFGRRLDRLMAKSALVVGGNQYLSARARRAGAPRVETLPTVIDLDRYPDAATTLAEPAGTEKRVVWIGSPATVHYLKAIGEPLRMLAQRMPFTLRVIGSPIELPGVDVEFVSWAEDIEAAAISACTVGIMPLIDSPWEQGKCGYKLIQYMACGLPVVASPVGVNPEIVVNGVNGYLARNDGEWIEHLEHILSHPERQRAMGRVGRQAVESRYCTAVTAPRLAQWFRRIGGEV